MIEILLAVAVALLPACGAEDASNCVWDSTEQGNGSGSSFVDIAGHVFPLELQEVERA